MIPIGIQRIEKRLEVFKTLIDMKDAAKRPTSQQEQMLRSRSLAAYCVKIIGETDYETAANSITDTFHDRGIDAVYFDPRHSRLLLVQAKFANGIEWKDAGEFVDGVRKLIEPDPAAFAKNEKLAKRLPEIRAAMLSSARLVLLTVHVGTDPADKGCLGRVNELVAEIDAGSNLAETVHWHQKHILDAIQSESSPTRIDADLYLSQWGEIREPYHAVYGRVQARAIVELWKANPNLAHMNLREYGRRTDVNQAIASTVQSEPEHFWYFNNGLTIICDSISPRMLGRLNHEQAVFGFEGISLVNGAQTTGILSDYLTTIPEDEQNKLWIQVRAIAVERCPDGFAKQVTRYTNLQNEVGLQDFVSLDPLQSRLAIDFAIDNRRYVFRSGEPVPVGEQGCTLHEATFALACAEPDSWYAVQAKREVSVLWRMETDAYRTLFHPNLTATRVWNAVRVMREAGAIISALTHNHNLEKAEMVATHLQWIVLHIAFRSAALADGNWERTSDLPDNQPIQQATADAFRRVCAYTAANHQHEYIASLSKNFEKCGKMVARILSTSPQPELFPDPRDLL